MTCARLVRFMASAFDTRYAFIAFLGARGGSPSACPLSLWLTRDHGLSVECIDGHLPDGPTSPEGLDGLCVLRRLRPLDSALRAMEKGGSVTIPLFDPQGALLGQLGVADPGAHWRLLERERLKPLARVAEAELTALRIAPSGSARPMPQR
jgi:hypothetical protein